jgi:hypothetical protein
MAHLPLEVEISGKDTQKWMILGPLNQHVKLVNMTLFSDPFGSIFKVLGGPILGPKRAILGQFAPRNGKSLEQILRSG